MSQDRQPARALLIVEEDRLAREGLRTYLTRAGFGDLIEAERIAEGLAIVQAGVRPAAVVVSAHQGDPQEIGMLAEFRRLVPDVRIMLVLKTVTGWGARRALDLNVNVCISKNVSARGFVSYLKAMMAGENLIALDVFSEALSCVPTNKLLSRREREVLECVERGLRNREIGTALGIRETTVKVYISRILRKTGVANRIEAARWIRRRGVGADAGSIELAVH